MISKILVALDGSEYGEKAFEYACYLAKRCGSALLIVHVLEEFVTVGHSILKELEEQDQVMLQKYKSRADQSAMITPIDVIECKGNDVAEEILRIADKENVDTIALGSRGTKAPSDFLIGSVSYKISHYAKCTVIIVR
jgi:nucleotide-binding universal stress UspA family protein